VDKNKEETALIWLNKDNADTLNKQLKQEQNSSIDELNSTKRSGKPDMVERTAEWIICNCRKWSFIK
jgi:type III restriction enzyme